MHVILNLSPCKLLKYPMRYNYPRLGDTVLKHDTDCICQQYSASYLLKRGNYLDCGSQPGQHGASFASVGHHGNQAEVQIGVSYRCKLSIWGEGFAGGLEIKHRANEVKCRTTDSLGNLNALEIQWLVPVHLGRPKECG